jgi:predicted acylesterase/phospholipase RssA
MSSSKIENILVLQGGGSLGAFGCGVFKALAKKNIKLDIVAGTSIGGINAAVIVGSIDKDHPELTLANVPDMQHSTYRNMSRNTIEFHSTIYSGVSNYTFCIGTGCDKSPFSML